jgi:hypothetical protein
MSIRSVLPKALFVILLLTQLLSHAQFMEFELKLNSQSRLQAVEISDQSMPEYIRSSMSAETVNDDYFWIKLSNYRNFDLYFEVNYWPDYEYNHRKSIVRVFDQNKEIYETFYDRYFHIRPITEFLFDQKTYIENPIRYQTYFGFPTKHTMDVLLIYN